MGLFTPTIPAWHPSPPALQAAARSAHAVLAQKGWTRGLADLAVGYAFGQAGAEAVRAPNVVGMSGLREVHENVRVWREVREGVDVQTREACEASVVELFAGMRDWAWASPPA